MAKVEFKLPSLSSEYVAHYAVEQMFKRKLVIIPGTKMKITHFFSHLVPRKLKLKITYKIQYRKIRQ